jgi:hypothetical protein
MFIKFTWGLGCELSTVIGAMNIYQRDSELNTPKLFVTFWLQKVSPSGSFIKVCISTITNVRLKSKKNLLRQKALLFFE